MPKIQFDLLMKESALVTDLFKNHGIVATHISTPRDYEAVLSNNIRCKICGADAYMRLESNEFRFCTIYCKTHFKDYCKKINEPLLWNNTVIK